MGQTAQQIMTDVLPMTDMTSLQRQQQILPDQVLDPAVPANNHPSLLPPVSTATTANDVAKQPDQDDAEPDGEDDGVIACICAFNTDDGNTIQCDKCMRWQHILCYYPPPEQTPDEESAHYCLDCQPRHLDARKATERQRKALSEQDAGQLPDKKPQAKSHKKKVRDSPSITANQPNGVDRHGHLASGDAKSGSPRDTGPPAAKRPKIAHKPSDKTSNPSSRKRGANSTSNTPAPATRSQSPDYIIPQYSSDFLRLFQSSPPQVDTATNLMNDIGVTNSLSEWLVDSKAVSKATRGLTPGDIFQRWPGRIEDIPGCPEVGARWVEDPRFATDGLVPRWAQMVIEDQIAPGAFIGELRGRISHIDQYHANPDNRWQHLRHPLPFVFFHPQLPICIDARQEGSIFRFVRRSCNPNSKLQTIITEGNEYHFCFMATRDIMPGEEISVAWSVPESISEKIKTSLGQTNNVQPNVREAICDWVSKVLSDCGPCACAGPAHCLMAHYDRRGQPISKVRRGKRARLLHIDAGGDGTRSRSASETTYKHESHDDAPGEHSNPATPGSDSRDMTPHAHDPMSAGGTVLPEMSERERKKLMREEEMFRRQEQANGKQRKKRPSGGSNLNTPTTATPVRGRGSLDMFDKPPPRKPAVDSAIENRSALGKRKSGQTSATSRRKSSAKTPRPVYVDASVQCDMDKDLDQAQSPIVPRRKFESLTQLLLRRCTLNNLERRASLVTEPATPIERSTEAMDVDVKRPDLDETRPNGIDPISEGKSAVEPSNGIPAPVPPDPGPGTDTVMPDVMPDAVVESASSPHSVVFSPGAMSSRMSTEAMLPPPTHSSPSKSPLPSIDAAMAIPAAEQPDEVKDNADAAPNATNSDNDSRPASEPPGLDPSATAAVDISQQPDTTGDAQGISGLLLAPSIAAAVAPSPVRKKLSLKDYTKRSKARPSVGEMTPASAMTTEPMSALLSPDSNPEPPAAAPLMSAPEHTNGAHVKSEQS